MQLVDLFWILTLWCIHPCSVQPASKESIRSQVSQVTLSKKLVTHTVWCIIATVDMHVLCVGKIACNLSARLHFICPNLTDRHQCFLKNCMLLSLPLLHFHSRYQHCAADTTITTTDSLPWGGGSVYVHCARG